MKAYELLDKPEKWTQGSAAKDAEGRSIDVLADSACQFCILGAIWKAYNHQSIKQENQLEQALGVRYLAKWNDAPERTWQEVHDKLKELDI